MMQVSLPMADDVDRPLAADALESGDGVDELAGDGLSADLPVAAPNIDRSVGELVQLFKLLSDETRLRILHYLSHAGELHVRALCERLHQSQPAVSHHLALLRVAGLIQLRRAGKHNFYHLEPGRFHEMLRSFFGFFPDNEVSQIVFHGPVAGYQVSESSAST